MIEVYMLIGVLVTPDFKIHENLMTTRTSLKACLEDGGQMVRDAELKLPKVKAGIDTMWFKCVPVYGLEKNREKVR